METSKRPIVVGLGELLWDCFPDARRPGGAPANVAFHARQLGLDGRILSRVGRDDLGDELLAFVAAHGLPTDHIQRDESHPTGRVDVTLNEQREPTYTFLEDVAWDRLESDAPARDLMAHSAAVCFGTLAQRSRHSRAAIQGCLHAAPADCVIVYDVNLRRPWYERAWLEQSFQRAQVVKMNDEEVRSVSGLFELASEDPEHLAKFLHAEFAVALFCVTRGARGCLLFDDQGHAVQQPAREIEVADPVGAGDAFTAALIFARLRGLSLTATASLATEVAGRVAEQHGAMPNLHAEFERLIARHEAPK